MQMTSRTLALTLLGFLCMTSRTTQAADPWEQGPYKVGVRTEVFVDEGRECAVTHGPRTLVTEIWYPSVDEPAVSKNKFSDFWVNEMGVGAARFAMQRFGGDFDQLDATFKNFAYRGADTHPDAFPLLIFSHGNGGLRHQNTFQCEFLASHGYVVAAPDHTGNAAVTVLPDRLLPYNAVTRQAERLDDRPHDVSFLITHLAELSATDDHWLSGRLMVDEIGMFGHSFGGFTTCRVTDLDDRIKAAIPMTLAGSIWTDEEDSQPCKVPLMVMIGDADRTVGEGGNARSIGYFEKASAPKYLLNFKNAGHFTFTEMLQINPDFGDGIGTERDKEGNITLTFSDAAADQRIINAYSVAFFDVYVKEDKVARSFLDMNQTPEELVYRKE